MAVLTWLWSSRHVIPASSADQGSRCSEACTSSEFSVSYPVNFFLITAMVPPMRLEPLLAGWTERLLPPVSSHILVRLPPNRLPVPAAFDERGANGYFQF